MEPSIQEHAIKAASSGLSIAEYARQNRLNLQALYRAKRTAKTLHQDRGNHHAQECPGQFLRVVMPKSQQSFGEKMLQIVLSREASGFWSVQLKAMRAKDVLALMEQFEVAEEVQG